VIYPNESQTADDVRLHYNELDEPYRRLWGEHVHHGYWATGREEDEGAAERLTALVRARLALRPGMRVCDIGCGYGLTGTRLAEGDGVEVTGFTLSDAQAERAQARGGRFTAFRRDWLDNGLPDAAFDRAYAIESSEHMVDKARFFAEAYRTLRPGGRLVVCAWLEGEGATAWQKRHLLEPICREGRLPSMGSRADYEALAAAAGFALKSHEDISRNVRRTWWLCARRLAAAVIADPQIRRLALSRHTQNRDFILSLPRLILALRNGAMRYGVFVWEKPAV
jgi:tocopherol O-methyltransferase